MEHLKAFAKYLKANYLNEFTKEYLQIIKALDIPIVKLVMEKNLYPDFNGEKGFELARAGQEKFLNSIIEETLYEEAKKGMDTGLLSSVRRRRHSPRRAYDSKPRM